MLYELKIKNLSHAYGSVDLEIFPCALPKKESGSTNGKPLLVFDVFWFANRTDSREPDMMEINLNTCLIKESLS